MRKMSSSLIGLTTALTLTVVACGDDPTGVTSGDELTTTEVTAVLAALSSAFESVGAGAQAAPGQVPISINETFSLSAACESGTIDVTFSIVTTATSIDVTITGTICGRNASAFETLGT